MHALLLVTFVALVIGSTAMPPGAGESGGGVRRVKRYEYEEETTTTTTPEPAPTTSPKTTTYSATKSTTESYTTKETTPTTLDPKYCPESGWRSYKDFRIHSPSLGSPTIHDNYGYCMKACKADKGCTAWSWQPYADTLKRRDVRSAGGRCFRHRVQLPPNLLHTKGAYSAVACGEIDWTTPTKSSTYYTPTTTPHGYSSTTTPKDYTAPTTEEHTHYTPTTRKTTDTPTTTPAKKTTPGGYYDPDATSDIPHETVSYDSGAERILASLVVAPVVALLLARCVYY